MSKPKNPSLRFKSAGLRALSFGLVDADKIDSFRLSELVLEAVEDLSEDQVKEGLKKFAKSVDDSPHTRAQWIEALAALMTFLSDVDKRASFDDLVGYISCCTESQAGTGIVLPLKQQVENFLRSSGFERAK